MEKGVMENVGNRTGSFFLGNTDGGVHSMENPNSWKVYFVENPTNKLMIQDDSGVAPYGKTKETWGNILGTNYADVAH